MSSIRIRKRGLGKKMLATNTYYTFFKSRGTLGLALSGSCTAGFDIDTG